jgi:hypothetical protein
MSGRSFGACGTPCRLAHASQREVVPVRDGLCLRDANKKHRHPLAEDERCWPVVPPLFAAVSRHAAFAARRASHSRCIDPVTGVAFPVRPSKPGCPSPPTGTDRVIDRSGRGSRVFFAGIPDPASQLPRFSASTLPGTRPCHRHWLFGCPVHVTECTIDCQGGTSAPLPDGGRLLPVLQPSWILHMPRRGGDKLCPYA